MGGIPRGLLPEAGIGTVTAITEAELDQGPAITGIGGPTAKLPYPRKGTGAHIHIQNEHVHTSNTQR